jgi:hypothetical protein
MKSYFIAGKEYAVIGTDLYERLPELTIAISDASVTPEQPAPVALVHRKKHQVKPLKPAKKSGKKSTAHCKNCGGYGHFAKTCPEKKPDQGPVAQPEERQSGKFVGTLDQLKAKVKEIRADQKGISSLRVAQMLGVRIEILNKVWETDPDGDEADDSEEKTP